MAERSVFSNETGQVMFGSGGNIYKVPYEFGNGLRLFNVNCPIVIDNIDLDIDNFTLGYWIRRIDSEATGVSYRDVNYIRLLYDNGYEAYISHRTGDQTTRFYPRITGPGTSGIRAHGEFEAYSILNKNSIQVYTPNVINTYDKTSSMDNSDATKVEKISLNAYHNLSIEDPRMNRIYDELIVFDRKISLDEYRHINNNRNGNPPLTNQGLFIYLKLNGAEILSIGGIDKVGVRDYSGNNRHGEIMNLPAGTLQEQLDWANANLFVPFIS